MEILDEVKENFDLSRLQLCITGGEPLLRPDFFALVEYAHSLGYSWGMTSNGTRITREVARRLHETGMGTISVSIDGLEATHDTQRRRPGAWKAAMRGIQNLIDEGGFHAIQVTTVMNHQSMDELDELYELFCETEIDSWRVIGIEPIGRALEVPERMLTPEDQRRLMDFIKEKREAEMPVTYGCSHFLGLDYEREVRKWYFLCNAGLYVASIMANGDVGACLDIERTEKTIQGSVYENRFTEIWRNRFELFRRPLSEQCRKCRECTEEKWCAGGSHHSWDYENDCQRICMKDILF
jgi:radical SAM protein with 4Fe4S-binding SPASM domain